MEIIPYILNPRSQTLIPNPSTPKPLNPKPRCTAGWKVRESQWPGLHDFLPVQCSEQGPPVAFFVDCGFRGLGFRIVGVSGLGFRVLGSCQLVVLAAEAAGLRKTLKINPPTSKNPQPETLNPNAKIGNPDTSNDISQSPKPYSLNPELSLTRPFPNNLLGALLKP